MPLQQLFTSRKPYDASTFVAHEGKLFYDEATGYLRLGDGTTPGGKVVMNLAIAAIGITAPVNPYAGELWYNPTSKELWAYYNGAFRGTINPATETSLGGIKAGPGVVVASDGTLSLDSTGIPFNFGDFYAFINTGTHDGACLSSINADQDVNIVSNGAGSVNIIGEFHIHTTDDNVEGALSVAPIFSVAPTGLTTIHTPEPPLGTAVLSVSSNESETVLPLAAGAAGAVLQLTGANDSSTTIAVDTFSNLAASSSNFTFRRYRGTVTTATAVQAGDLMAAIGSTAFDGVGTASLPGQVTSIRYVAAENQTPTNKGSRIDMYAIPINTSSRTLNLSLNGTYVSVPLETQSTSTNTGALITAGGLGVAKDVWVGGKIVATTVTATNLIGTLSPSSQLGITQVGTLTGLALAGGTTSTYALKFNTGTTLTAAQTGAVEYDGTVFYATPLDQERGLIQSHQGYIVNTDRALTNDINPQSLYGAGFHVTAGKRYRYQMLFTVTKTGGNGVNIGYGLLVNGGGALSRHIYRATSTIAASALVPSAMTAMRNSITTGFATPVDISGALTNGASGSTLEVVGILDVTASGYITPQITFLNNPPTGATLLGASSIAIWPVGSTGTNTVIGNWA